MSSLPGYTFCGLQWRLVSSEYLQNHLNFSKLLCHAKAKHLMSHVKRRPKLYIRPCALNYSFKVMWANFQMKFG